MKYRLFTLSLVLLTSISFFGFAGHVDQATARKFASNFFQEKILQKQLDKNLTNQINDLIPISFQNQVCLYAINFSDGGYMLLSTDDNAFPVIAFSYEGSYVVDNHSPSFDYWLNGTMSDISKVIENQYPADQSIQTLWSNYLDAAFVPAIDTKNGKDVEPLIKSKWDQGKYYNTLCPKETADPSGHVPTGCVATSIAQLMYYYRYPETGMGAHGYYANNPNYGNYGYQYADYGATTYNWDHMVNQPNEGNLAIATLMYHCGVSVNMSYGPTASGAYTADVPYALINYFKYSSSTSFAQKMSYSNAAWDQLLQGNLDNEHPMIYSGSGSNGGHAWMCDGYQLNGGNTWYHMNWGWGGSDDGYFYLNNLNPSNQGPFNSNNGVVKNAFPVIGYPTYCAGQKVITSNFGSIVDGSSHFVYGDNANCSWLIAPADSVKKITLTFEQFETEAAGDIVTVYDGDNTSAPVLLTHSGGTLPAGSVMSTGSKMLVTFTSNTGNNFEGFYAQFKSTFPTYCNNVTLTAPQGTLGDGSNGEIYNNNTTCNYTIDVPFGLNLTLTFTQFDLEPDNDFVKIYDLATSQLLQTYSGHSIPAPVTSPSGKMWIVFKSDFIFNFQGWEATYTVGNLGLEDNNSFKAFSVYPNPASDVLHIDLNSGEIQNTTIELSSMNGQVVYKEEVSALLGDYRKDIELSGIAKGVYLIKVIGEKSVITRKVTIQ